MSIEKKCKKCVYNEYGDCCYDVCAMCLIYDSHYICADTERFAPKEELVREDERNKIIDLIEFSPLVVCDGDDGWICNKAIQAYREKLLYKLKNLKIMEV